MQRNKEIKYLRFLNNTLQTTVLRNDICDEFTRKIFDYLEAAPAFNAQVFCAFLYHFIHRCKLKRGLVMTAETNVYDRIRLDAGSIANDLSLFLGLHSIRFALSTNPNQFTVSLEEKLKHLLFDNNEDAGKPRMERRFLSWRNPRVKIVLPEMKGNTGIVPFVYLEFTMPALSVGQKLDVLHFAICALNYLSQRDDPITTFSNPEIPQHVLVSKPEHLKIISDNLLRVRDSVVLNAIRDKEGFEFDEQSQDIARILTVQNRDLPIKKQWLEGNPILALQSDEKPKAAKAQGYPPFHLQQIIDTAVRLYEVKDKVRAIDIYTELGIERNTYHKRIKYFGYDTARILSEARTKRDNANCSHLSSDDR